MIALESTFLALRERGQTGFFPFLTAGFTSLELTRRIMARLSDGLADGFELGIPYSDPLADGPSIQFASEWALNQGVKTDKVLSSLADISTSVKPVVLMTYYNVVFKLGLENFATRAKDSGAAGVIIPDLAIEESDAWRKAAADKGLATIFMVAPTSSDERIKAIAAASTGFVYCVSLMGVTGARTELPSELPELIGKIKEYTQTPVVVGFGVSNKDQARSLKGVADGIIVGSALVNAIKAGQDDDEREVNAVALAEDIMEGLGRR